MLLRRSVEERGLGLKGIIKNLAVTVPERVFGSAGAF